ncbi:MAG: hypothetical protein R6V85_11710 [Polyangia bacterium]
MRHSGLGMLVPRNIKAGFVPNSQKTGIALVLGPYADPAADFYALFVRLLAGLKSVFQTVTTI